MTSADRPAALRRDLAVLSACGAVAAAGVAVALLLGGPGTGDGGPAGSAPPPVPATAPPSVPASAVTSVPAPVGPPVPSVTGVPTVATGTASPPDRAEASAPASVPPTAPAVTAGADGPPVVPATGATPAPAWLGTRPLGPAGAGPVGPQETPPELRDRRIATVDVLPPPTEDGFVPVVSAVPPDVLARSTWQPACPVPAEDLRYLLVPHWGFDGRPHTGEVLVHADAVDVVLDVFAALHVERFPLEEVRVVRADELTAAPTGDGNVTSAFVCRPTVGGGDWSQHAYGRALDVNPFHNPYDRGAGAVRVVLPELATAYTDRTRELPGMLDGGSAAVRAAEAAGWGWGGRYRTLEDWMHLSADAS